jgi:hypothetical protein
MQWYDPSKPKTAGQNAQTTATAQSGQQAAGVNFTDPYNKGANSWTGSTGNVNDPFAAHESGWDTYKRSRNDAYTALKSGFTDADPADMAAMGQLRDYYTNYLGDLQKNSQGQMSQFDTQSQRGLANLLSQHKAANAGTGNIGSRQYAGAEGDIVSRAAGDYMTGVMDNRNQELARAGQVQGGLSGIYNQGLAERGYQYGQSKDLANYLSGIGKTEIAREGSLPQQEESNWLADIAPLAGAGIGAAFGNPMLGYGIGSAAGGAMRGGESGGAGGGTNLAALLAMQNSNSGSGNTVGGGLPTSSQWTVGAANGMYR